MNAVHILLWTDSTEVTEKHTRSGINKYNFLKTIYSSLYLKEKFNFYECFLATCRGQILKDVILLAQCREANVNTLEYRYILSANIVETERLYKCEICSVYSQPLYYLCFSNTNGLANCLGYFVKALQHFGCLLLNEVMECN